MCCCALQAVLQLVLLEHQHEPGMPQQTKAAKVRWLLLAAGHASTLLLAAGRPSALLHAVRCSSRRPPWQVPSDLTLRVGRTHLASARSRTQSSAPCDWHASVPNTRHAHSHNPPAAGVNAGHHGVGTAAHLAAPLYTRRRQAGQPSPPRHRGNLAGWHLTSAMRFTLGVLMGLAQRLCRVQSTSIATWESTPCGQPAGDTPAHRAPAHLAFALQPLLGGL